MTRMKVKGNSHNLSSLGFGVNQEGCGEGECWILLPYDDAQSMSSMVREFNIEVLVDAEVI